MLRFCSLSTLVFLASTALACADTSACASIKVDNERLACFDSLFLPDTSNTELNPSSTDATTEAEVETLWVFQEARDEFSEKETSYVVLESDKAVLNRTDAPRLLVIRCDGSGGVDTFVSSGGYIGATRDRIPVRYRFGSEKPISESWHESTNGKSAFLPTDYKEFLAGVASGVDFIFEITDYRGSKYSAKFPKTGLSADYQYVVGGCKSKSQ